MSFAQAPLAIPPIICLALLLIVIAFSWRSAAQVGRSYLYLLMAVAGWVLANIGEKFAASETFKLFFANSQYFFGTITGFLWFAFACQFTGRRNLLTPNVVRTLLLVPVLIAILAAIDPWTHGLRRSVTVQTNSIDWLGSFPVLHVEYGPLFYVMLGYCYVLAAIGLTLLAIFAVRGSPHFRWRIILLLCSCLIPLIANLAYVLGYRPLGDIDLSPFGLTIGVTVGAWSLLYQRALDIVPVARDIVFQAQPDPAFVIDNQDRIVDANRSANLLSAHDRLAPGAVLVDVLPELRKRIHSEQPPTDDDEEYRQPISLDWSGQTRRFEIRVTSLDEFGLKLGKLVQLIDITERLQLLEHRERLNETVHRSQMLESLGYLAGTVAHDFNDLLVGIMGNAALARDEAEPNSMVRRLVDRILVSAEHAAELTQQLQAYSGQRPTELRPVSLPPLIDEMVDFLRWTVTRNVRIEAESEPGLPWIQADPVQIRQVITNLVANASDAIGASDGRITIRSRRGVLSGDDLTKLLYDGGVKPGEYVSIEVSDNGCGMTTEVLARVLEPFFTTKKEGRGLGLAAVVGVIRAHRGAIDAESRPGSGTTFRLLFSAQSQPTTDPNETLTSKSPSLASQVDCDVPQPSVD